MKTAEIRRRFVDYYEDIGYQSLPSSPMIDPSIPMSFVMSAGLVQVENSLAKSKVREGNQYVLVQNCFRHFDLERVGTDDIHLSLFEMPGAFAFGPDGRAGTIQRMWKLATNILGLDKEKIWVTYFGGGKVLEDYLLEDSVTKQAWLAAGPPPNHIVGLGSDNNFWVQGRGIKDTSITKKCGPNTEIFFDRGPENACSVDCKPSCKCGRFVELANSLFICSEVRLSNGSLQPLENPFAETVIGTERIAMIQQASQSVFEIDTFRPLVETIHQFVRTRIPLASLTAHERVIADHIKGLYFLIADGAPPPGKDGRARIIKMLIRRIITRQILLGIDSGSFLPEVLNRLSQTVPENMKETCIKEQLFAYFSSELERFSKTIKRGELKLWQMVKENAGQTLSGLQILCLEKQFGLPPLLTDMILRKQELAYQKEEYESVLSITSETEENYIIGRQTEWQRIH